MFPLHIRSPHNQIINILSNDSYCFIDKIRMICFIQLFKSLHSSDNFGEPRHRCKSSIYPGLFAFSPG